ncbi:hypothetical protein ACI2OX_20540 [Bacillus sp. N9]
MHRANDPDRLEGAIIRSLAVAIVDGDLPRTIGKEYVGSYWETIDMDHACRTANLDEKVNEINALSEQKDIALNNAYKSYAAGLRVHDDWEKYTLIKWTFKKQIMLRALLFQNYLPKRKKRKGNHLCSVDS